MKDSLSNPVRYNKIIVIEAVLLTITIHLLFFYIFSVPAERKQNEIKENTTVTLLRFGGTESNDVKIKNFIRKYNPAHFSNPHSPLGYSSFRSKNSRDLPKLAPLSDNSLQIKSEAEKNNFALPQNVVKNIPLPAGELPVSTNDTVNQISYPFAVSSSGVIVPLTFSTDEQRMINEFPLTEGVYKVFKNKDNNTIRLALLRSCGRRALDRLSIKNLYQEMNKIKNCADGEIFTVFYREPEIPGGAL